MRAGRASPDNPPGREPAPSLTELVLRCLSAERGDDLERWLGALDGRWDALIGEAERQALAPLLYCRLKSFPSTTAPPAAVLETLHGIYLHNALRNTVLLEELVQLLGVFRELGMTVMALKGIHLAALVYGDPALRPMADMDLMARPEDVPRIRQAILGLGYEQFPGSTGAEPGSAHHHLSTFRKPDAIPVEVHRALSPPESPFRVDVAALWERSRPVEIGGVPVQVLAPDDLVLHLCTHAAYNHRFAMPVVFLCDIAAILRRYGDGFDWRRLAATANQDGRSAFAYCTLRLVATTLGVELPRGVLDDLRHDQLDAEVVDAARDYLLGPPLEVPAGFQRVAGRGGVAQRLRAIAGVVFPPAGRMREIYGLPVGSARAYLYYLYRPIDLLIRRGRLAGGLLLRTERLRPALEQEARRRAIQQWVARIHPE